MLVCINRTASAWPVIRREGHFCVNSFAARHQHIADRFAGGDASRARPLPKALAGGQFPSGALGLEDALAVIDCTVEEIIERHSHGIVIGAVRGIHVGAAAKLIYGHGALSRPRLDLTDSELSDFPMNQRSPASQPAPTQTLSFDLSPNAHRIASDEEALAVARAARRRIRREAARARPRAASCPPRSSTASPVRACGG